MKKGLIIVVAMLFGALQLNAQKVGYIDTEKILSVIPAYKNAQTQLEALSEQYQKKIESEYAKIEVMYNNYQKQKTSMSSQLRAQRENEIIEREKTVKQLQMSYFGQDGQMQKKSAELLDPIKERVDAAIAKVAAEGKYTILFDIAAMQGVAYKNADDDLSPLVIKILGY